MKKRGSKQIVKGRLYGLFWLGGVKRESVPVPGVSILDDAAVEARCELIANATQRMVDAGLTDRARDMAVQLGAETNQKRLEKILKTIDSLVTAAKVTGAGHTWRQVGGRWTSGELHRLYPDHVKKKGTSSDDAGLLKKYVYPVVGDTALKLFRLEDAERVMARLPPPPELSVARRRHVAQAMHRLLNIAVYPLKLIQANPLPRGFLPKLPPGKAKQYLYPDEDRKLMGSTMVPLEERLFYGFMAREGCRFEEALTLAWTDLDLERGAVKLDRNKTDDPRAWALRPGTALALKKWKTLRPNTAGPFAGIPDDDHQADRFRFDVRAAGIERAGLHEATDHSMRLRFHDLRATFVTESLATGKSETWVSDRTGHKSSDQIAKYKRAARTYAELQLGPLADLGEVIVWEQDPKCQTSVQRGRYERTSKRVMTPRKRSFRTEAGTRTQTALRPADFESDSLDRPVTGAREIKWLQHQETTGERPFDSGLTDLGEIHRGWSAYAAMTDRMAAAEGRAPDDDGGAS